MAHIAERERRDFESSTGKAHEVRGLFVGDASLLPRTISVNPSLTVMALTTRLAERLELALSGELAVA